MFQTRVLEKTKKIMINFFSLENHAIHWLMWKNIVKQDRAQ